MAKLDDVAKLAGVSKTTASRVLNNRGYISQETRDNVFSAMKELNYRVKDAAFGMLKSGGGTIGILIPDICYPHYSKIALVLEGELSKRGYRPYILNVINCKKLGLDELEIFNTNHVNGLILCNRSLTPEEYEKIDIPVVSVDRYINANVSTISSDHIAGGKLAAEALMANGCKCVLQTAGTDYKSSPWGERHYIFEKTLKEHGITCYTEERDPMLISDVTYNRKYIGSRLQQHPDIDGYFGNDVSAIATLLEVRSRGMRVPEDFKIIASDGSYITELCTPNLTTIRQPVDKIASLAVDSICKLIEDHMIDSCEIKLKVDFIQRGSTFPCELPE